MFENSNYYTKASEQFYETNSLASSSPSAMTTTSSTTESSLSSNDLNLSPSSTLQPLTDMYKTDSTQQQQQQHQQLLYNNSNPTSSYGIYSSFDSSNFNQHYTHPTIYNNSYSNYASYAPYYSNTFNSYPTSVANNYANFLPFSNANSDPTPSVKPHSPLPNTYSVSSFQTTNDQQTTPEKPVMNDSGIDVISPQLSLNTTTYQQLYASNTANLTQSTSSITESATTSSTTTDESLDEDDDNDDEDDSDESSKENLKAKASGKPCSTGKASLTPAKPPKPYLEIIADAILSCKVKMMQLHEIYHYMESKYEYFVKNVNKSWRNSVRHNLSLNECFVKAGRGSNGKGNYWKIHPLCEKEFIRGCFRRKSFKQLIRAGSAGHASSSSQSHSLPHYNLPVDYAINFRSMVPPPLPQQFIGSSNSTSLSSFQYPVFGQQQQDQFGAVHATQREFAYSKSSEDSSSMNKSEPQLHGGFNHYRITN